MTALVSLLFITTTPIDCKIKKISIYILCLLKKQLLCEAETAWHMLVPVMSYELAVKHNKHLGCTVNG